MAREDVWAEIVARLRSQQRVSGDFAGVHICPAENADVPDTDEARLVVLHPKVSHARKTESPAWEFVKNATERKGGANRVHRNMVVYLAADETRLAELEIAVRDFLGWSHVLDNEADLDLSINQKQQATQRKEQAGSTVESRLLQVFVWALVPHQPDPSAPFEIRESKVEGESTSLAPRVSRRLGNDGDLATRQAAASIRLAIQRVPRIWEAGHVSVGELWKIYATYPYMPRLRDRSVLDVGVTDQPMLWQNDGFALAASYDEANQRYVDLVAGSDADNYVVSDTTLLVKPEFAEAQLQAEAVQAAAPTPEPHAQSADAVQGTESPSSTGEDRGVDIGYRAVDLKTRFYGVKTLRSEKMAADFKSVMDEVVNHFRDESGTDVTVKIEIEATDDAGFGDSQVRTVSENARTLKFDESGFEES